MANSCVLCVYLDKQIHPKSKDTVYKCNCFENENKDAPIIDIYSANGCQYFKSFNACSLKDVIGAMKSVDNPVKSTQPRGNFVFEKSISKIRSEIYNKPKSDVKRFKLGCPMSKVLETKAYDNEIEMAPFLYSDIDCDKSKKDIVKNHAKLGELRICILCGKLIYPDKPSNIDHIIPKVRGGTSKKDNLAIVHKACNTKKKFLTLAEYLIIMKYSNLDDYEQRMLAIADLYIKYEFINPYITKARLSMQIRYYIEQYFPCIPANRDEEMMLINMYHPKVPSLSLGETNNEFSNNQWIQEQICEIICNNYRCPPVKLTEEEVKSIIKEIKKYLLITESKLTNEDKAARDDLERKLFLNKGFTVQNSKEFANILGCNHVHIKRTIKKMIEKNSIKVLRTKHSSYLYT